MPETTTHKIQAENKRNTFQTYLQEIVYGGSDGIVTTFAVVAGFTGAQSGEVATYSVLTVLLFGLANLFADATSMGLGNFLSLRAEQDLYKAEAAKELQKIRTNPEKEKEKTRRILQHKGFSQTEAAKITEIYATNENYWTQFMMNHVLERADTTGSNPLLNGLATFTAFILFGVIPLIPYILSLNSDSPFLYSCAATASALILLGLLKWKITGENVVRSVVEIVAIGSVSAGIAYFVGSFFKV